MRNVAIVLGVLNLIGAGLAWVLVPNPHEAAAQLKISSQVPAVLVRASEGSPDDFQTFKRTQAQLVRSPQVLGRALGQTTISHLPLVVSHEDDPVSWLEERLIVDYPDNAEVMRVAIEGSEGDSKQLKKIVDAVVNCYLTEVVQHDRDLRNDHYRKLQQTYEIYLGEVKTQNDTLHKLQALHKTSSTEAAQVKRKMELEKLAELMTQRAKLQERLDEQGLHIALRQARDELAQTAPASESKVEENGVATSQLSLPLLLKQQEHLEALFKEVGERMNEQADVVARLDNFNVNVQSKLDELKAWQAITGDLRAELDRIKVEQLAPERIIKIDDATWHESRRTPTEKYAGMATAAVLGLGLIAFGTFGRRRKT